MREVASSGDPADTLARLAREERGGVELAPGAEYRTGEPVRVTVAKRGHRYDIHDAAGAVRRGGKPRGRLEAAGAVVGDDALSVNRRGVGFVPAVAGRDVDSLAGRVATTSACLYGELLDLTVAGSR